MNGFLSTEQRVELLHELKVERNAKYSDRLKDILLIERGWIHEKIAEALFLDEGTIRNYRKRYVEGGVFGLVTDNYFGKRSCLADKDKELLSNFLRLHILMGVMEVAAYIKKKFDVNY